MTSDATELFAKFILALCFLACVTCGAYGACHGDHGQALHVLDAQGYTDVELTGPAPLSCGKGDWSRVGFRGLGPSGVPVEGAVCCGFWAKGCTVRTY